MLGIFVLLPPFRGHFWHTLHEVVALLDRWSAQIAQIRRFLGKATSSELPSRLWNVAYA